MTDNFPKAVDFILAHEGTYSNDLGDPGGETHWGISKRAYPNLDIKNLTRDQAIEIYRKDYWQKCGCDAMPWPMDLIVFDSAVNCGPIRALYWLRQQADPTAYLFLRLAHYAVQRGAAIYLRGWLNRVIDLYKEIS
jgi:lysozyme family protein